MSVLPPKFQNFRHLGGGLSPNPPPPRPSACAPMLKLQEIFTTVTIVCHCYERLAVLQNVFTIILLKRR